MTKSLGPKLPPNLAMRLYQPDETSSRQRIIIVTTVDQDGWPRHMMLSHYEVVAKDQSHLLLLAYAESKSTRNLLRSGLATLLFFDEEMNYYVRAKCTPDERKIADAPSEVLFSAEVEDVIEDKFPTTTIISGLKYSGFDPGMSEENRKRVFKSLVEL